MKCLVHQSVKGQIVNNVDFLGHTVSAAAAQPLPLENENSTDDIDMTR